MRGGGTLVYSRVLLSLLSLEPIQDPGKREAYCRMRRTILVKTDLVYPVREESNQVRARFPRNLSPVLLKVEPDDIQQMLCEREETKQHFVRQTAHY